jgi:hypothetical protein
MKRLAKIENGVVKNVVMSEEDMGEGYVEITSSTGECSAGDSYDSSTGEFVHAEVTAEVIEAEAKDKLADTDWTMLPDIGLTTSCIANFIAYRQTLRNLVKNPVSGAELPVKPEVEYI